MLRNTGRVVAVKVEADGDLHIALADANGEARLGLGLYDGFHDPLHNRETKPINTAGKRQRFWLWSART